MTAARGSDEAPTPAASAASSSSVDGFSLNTSRPICTQTYITAQQGGTGAGLGVAQQGIYLLKTARHNNCAC
jgi:hypothetical protein